MSIAELALPLRLRIALFSFAFALVGCQAALGIEDRQRAPRDASDDGPRADAPVDSGREAAEPRDASEGDMGAAGGGETGHDDGATEGGTDDGSGAGGAAPSDDAAAGGGHLDAGADGDGSAPGSVDAGESEPVDDGGVEHVVWSRAVNGPANSDSVEHVAVDAQGNVYFAGQIGSTTTFGCDTHSVSGGRDAYLVKYARDGSCVWSKTFGAGADEGSVYATGVALSPGGDVIIVGFFDQVTTFGTDPLFPKGASDIYLAKFSSDGRPIWSRSYGTSAAEWAWEVAFDGAGGIYVAGHYDGTTDLGSGTLSGFGYNDMFLAKFADGDDANGGATSWARGYGAPGSSSDWFTSVGINAAGEVVAAGSAQGAIDFDGIGVSHVGGEDIVVTRHSPVDGHVIWAKAYGAAGDDRAETLAISNSSVLVGGWFYGKIDFGGTPLVSQGGSRDGLLLELGLGDGAVVRADRWGGPFEDTVLAVALSAEGRIAVGGSFQGMAHVMGEEVSANGGNDALAFVLGDDHQASWVGHWGSDGRDELLALSWYGLDGLAVGGRFSKEIDLQRPPLQSAGEPDIFLARLQP